MCARTQKIIVAVIFRPKEIAMFGALKFSFAQCLLPTQSVFGRRARKADYDNNELENRESGLSSEGQKCRLRPLCHNSPVKNAARCSNGSNAKAASQR